MDADLVNSFVGSAQTVLQSEIGAPIQMGQLSVQKEAYTSQQITALIGVTGNLRGVMMFGLSEETAKRLVSQMMGQEIDKWDELAESGIAEMGNVIAGTAATTLASRGYVCTISPPTVITGAGTTISTLNIPRLVIPLVTPFGLVEVQLALKTDAALPQAVVARVPVYR
ncbi:MAG: chemotaxis protein CheX [Dehalococcoidia bacterium]|nr:chemotaxis protein CheX [Dehalococcoidia bacterium]